MAITALDSSVYREPGTRLTRKTVLITTVAMALSLGAGYACLTGIAESAVYNVADMAVALVKGRPAKGVIATGPVADMPPLKDGVPALAPVRSIALSPAAPGAPTQTAAMAVPSAPALVPSSDSKAMAALIDGPAAPAKPGSRSAVMTPQVAALTAPVSVKAAAIAPKPGDASVARVASIPLPPQHPTVISASPAPAVAALTAPLPPGRALASAEPRDSAKSAAPARPATQTSIVAIAPAKTAPAPAPTRIARATTKPASVTTGSLATAEAEPEDETMNVFGLSVPTIGTTARRIQKGAETFGKSLASLPEKL